MNIFRHEKTKRIIGDDLVRAEDIVAEFWEASTGGLSAAGTLTQPIQTLASAGATAFKGSAGLTQILETLGVTAHNLTTAGSLSQPLSVLASGGSQAFRASAGVTQPVSIIASDGKQTYIGSISFEQAEMTLSTASKETHLASLSIDQFLQTLGSTAQSAVSAAITLLQWEQVLTVGAEMGATTPGTLEAIGSLIQRSQRIFGCARISPPPFKPSILPMNVLTGRKYRKLKRYSYTKKGKPVFQGWTKL
jgi:hypothetical protein